MALQPYLVVALVTVNLTACGREAAIQLALGDNHTCALLEGGDVRCWGSAEHLGVPGQEDIGDDEAARDGELVDVGGHVTQITAGRLHTCALLTTGKVRCWGINPFGQLGYADTEAIGDDESPASAGDVDIGAPVVQVVAGGDHTCALLYDGAVRCWGTGYMGSLGYGNEETIGDDESPADAGDVFVGGTVVQLALGFFHTCALLDRGAVRCWGGNVSGQLGYGDPEHPIGDDESPASAGDIPVGGKVVEIAAGHQHTCVLLDGGAVRCWGFGHAPEDVDIDSKAVHVTAGGQHTCALFDTGKVGCWGWGSIAAQLGYGDANDTGGIYEPPPVIGDVQLGGRALHVVAGSYHNCALLEGGDLRCWGSNGAGRLGYGHTDPIGDDEVPASAGDVPYR